MIRYPFGDLVLLFYDRARLARIIKYKYYQLKTLCVKFILEPPVYILRMEDTHWIGERF